MAADPLVAVAAHAKTGDRLLLRLKSARERGKIAEYVCALRRWHRSLRPLVQAYSAPLAESLRMLNPRCKEYERVAGNYTSLAQWRLLMTTATALYRLSPHLLTARRGKPGRKTGQGAREDGEALAEMARLINEKGSNEWAAARDSVHLADHRGTPDVHQRTKRIYNTYRRVHRINLSN